MCQETKNSNIGNLPVRTKSNLFLLFSGLLLVMIVSCSGGEAYSRFYHVKNGKWLRDSVLVFTIDSLPPSLGGRYDMSVEVTTNRSYPYRNLWLLVDHNRGDSLVATDTLRFLLADEYGKWLGGGAGGLNQFSMPYSCSIPYDSLSNYRLVIRHGMEEELLCGVEKVGIKM